MDGTTTTAVVTVNGRDVTVTFDETHLLAHVEDFFVPWEEVLRVAATAVDPSTRGMSIATVNVGRPVGRSRLVALDTSDQAYWGFRPGRIRPSHLIACEPRPTHLVTAWGEWTDANTLVLHTVFPGPSAPREIHDPDLPLDEIDASIEFWTTHALAQR